MQNVQYFLFALSHFRFPLSFDTRNHPFVNCSSEKPQHWAERTNHREPTIWSFLYETRKFHYDIGKWEKKLQYSHTYQNVNNLGLSVKIRNFINFIWNILIKNYIFNIPLVLVCNFHSWKLRISSFMTLAVLCY